MTKKLSTRIAQKHDLEVNWRKATNFIPMKGEIIIYDAEVDSEGTILELPAERTFPYEYERIKIGDGVKTASALPFVVDEIHAKIMNVKEEDAKDLSLQELYNSGALFVKPHVPGEVDSEYCTISINENTNAINVVSPPIRHTDLYIKYTGHISFKVWHSDNSSPTVRIDGKYIPTLVTDQCYTVYSGYVENEISIYGTVDYWRFEYLKSDHFILASYVENKLSEAVTEAQVDEKIATLVDSAPETLNTLNELSKALGDDENFATTVTTHLGGKVDKVEGKGLSTNDFTNDYKTLVDSLQNGVNTLNSEMNEVQVELDELSDTVASLQPVSGLVDYSVSDLIGQGILLYGYNFDLPEPVLETPVVQDNQISNNSRNSRDLKLNYRGEVAINVFLDGGDIDGNWARVDGVYIDIGDGHVAYVGSVQNEILLHSTFGEYTFNTLKLGTSGVQVGALTTADRQALKKIHELPLVKGEGLGSVTQKNVGVTNSSGQVVDEPIATGHSAIAFGAATEAHGNASLAIGYGAEAYQQGSSAFGSSIAGDKDKQNIFSRMLTIVPEVRLEDANNDSTLTDEQYLYIKDAELGYNNFNKCKTKYNDIYPEERLADTFTVSNFKGIKYSFAFAAGDGNTATGRNSVALGGGNTTTQPAAVGIGAQNEVLTENSVAVGALNKVSTNNGIVALGYGNNVSGGYSIGVGKNNTVAGSGSGALGLNNEISSSSTFALGDRNKIAGDFGAAIGSFNEIKKGTGNFISGVYNTIESGSHASVLGSYNKANATYQTVIGKYNKPDASKIFIVGGGTGTDDASRKNLFTVDYSGNITTPGSITSSTTTDLYQKIDNYIYTFENYRKIENFASTINGVTLSCKNMKLVATSTKADTNITHIYDKKRLNGSIYKVIKIKFKTTATDPTSCIYFDTNNIGYNSATTIDGESYRAIQYFTLTNNEDGTYTGIANLSDNKIWTTSDTAGGIKSIRFDIPNYSAIGDTTEIEYIGIFSSLEEAEDYQKETSVTLPSIKHEQINLTDGSESALVLATGNITFNMLELNAFSWGSLANTFYIKVSNDFMNNFKKFYNGKNELFIQPFIVLNTASSSHVDMPYGNMLWYGGNVTFTPDYESSGFHLHIIGAVDQGLSVEKFIMFFG